MSAELDLAILVFKATLVFVIPPVLVGCVTIFYPSVLQLPYVDVVIKSCAAAVALCVLATIVLAVSSL